MSTHGRSLVPLPFLHAVDVDLKVARFLLSLIPAIIIGTRLKYIIIKVEQVEREEEKIKFIIGLKFFPLLVSIHIYIYIKVLARF